MLVELDGCFYTKCQVVPAIVALSKVIAVVTESPKWNQSKRISEFKALGQADFVKSTGALL